MRAAVAASWDPGQSTIVFWSVGRNGELHRGTVTYRDEQIWHDATVSGGSVAGYRSVLEFAGPELHYRARYEASPTDESVLAVPPLVYRRDEP